MRILILMDDATLVHLESGRPPVAAYSHDKNLFQLAHESLRKGHDVYICSIQQDKRETVYRRIYSVYPVWHAVQDGTEYVSVSPDIVAGVFLEAMNIRSIFPHAKIVAIQAAIHWTESPETFDGRYLFDSITAIRYNVDYVITQNDRMKNILDVFFKFVAGTDLSSRILVCPLGIVEEERRESVDRTLTRKQMGVEEGDIAIVNSGGVWCWTDFLCFIRAFCRYCSDRESRIKLFIMGFQQPENTFHTDYIGSVKSVIYGHAGLIGKNIFVEDDWYRASSVVKRYTAAADIGLNVNLPSLENWQSYRLRFLDYLYFGLPAINTVGDQVADEIAPESLFIVRSGDEAGYVNVLREIEDNPSLVIEKGSAMRRLADRFDSRLTYGSVIDALLRGSQRVQPGVFDSRPSVLDFANDRARDMFRHRIADRLADWMAD